MRMSEPKHVPPTGLRRQPPYRHVVRVHVVKGVHMAVDMEQVTLHHTRDTRTDTRAHAPRSTLHRCAVATIPASCARPAAAAARSPIAKQTCVLLLSLRHTHSHSHTYALPAPSAAAGAAAAAAVAMGTAA